MSIPVNPFHQNPNMPVLNQNIIGAGLDLFINNAITLEQLQQEIATYDLQQLTQLLTSIQNEYYLLTFNDETMQILLDRIQKQAISVTASKLFHHQDLTADSIDNSILREFLNRFTELQDKLGINNYIQMGNELYLSPVALLMHLPKHLISFLNPEALQDSLSEISKNKNNCLFTSSYEISIEYLKNLFFYLNKGFDLSPIFGEEFRWVLEQPLFQNVPMHPTNFYDLFLEPILNRNVNDKFSEFFHVKLFLKSFENKYGVKIYGDFAIFSSYLWSMAEILRNHPVINVVINCFNDEIKNKVLVDIIKDSEFNKIFFEDGSSIYVDKKSEKFDCVFLKFFESKLNKIEVFRISSNFIFSEGNEKKRKLNIEPKSNKRLKTTDSSSSSAISKVDDDGISTIETVQISPFLFKMSKFLKKLVVTDAPNKAWSSVQLNTFLTCFAHLKSLKLPIELISENDLDSVDFKNISGLKIGISSKTLALSDDNFKQQLLILKKISFKKINIVLDDSNSMLNYDRLIPIIQHSRNSWEIKHIEYVLPFINIFYKLGQLDFKDQIKLYGLFEDYADIIEDFLEYNELDSKLIDHILLHIFSSYTSFPRDFPELGSRITNGNKKSLYFPIYIQERLIFSDEIVKNSEKLKFLIQRFFDNPSFVEHFPTITTQLLIAALEKSEPNFVQYEDDMQVDLGEEIPQSKLDAILFSLINANSLPNSTYALDMFSKSPKLFNRMMTSQSFIKKIPSYARQSCDLLCRSILFFPQIEENWLKLLSLLIKNQIVQNDSKLQEVFIEELTYCTPYVALKILDHIQKGVPSEVDRNIKALLFLAPLFAQKLLNFYDNNLCDVAEFNKNLSLFIKKGWIPSLEECFRVHPRFAFLLMDSLKQALPHLNELQKKWVSVIIPKIAEKPELTESEQEAYLQLFNYHCAQKKRAFDIALDTVFLDQYPYLFDQILSCYINKLATEPSYVGLGMQLITIALSQKVEDDVNARKILMLLDGIITNFPSSILTIRLINLLYKASCLPYLLKQAYCISKNGEPKLIRPSVRLIVDSLWKLSNPIPKEIEYLLAHAVIELKTEIPIQFLRSPTIFYDVFDKRKLKEVPEILLINLIFDFNIRLQQLAENPDEKLQSQIIEHGKKITQFIINSQSIEIGKLFFISQNSDISPYRNAIITTIFEQLSTSSEFIETVMKNKHSRLKFFNICQSLPSLIENVMDIYFRCLKFLYLHNEINSLFPLKGSKNVIEKLLKYMVKYPDKFLRNSQAINYELLGSLRKIRDSSISLDIVSKVVQLFFKEQDATTLFWLGQFYPNDMKTLLGRELNREELSQLKWCPYLLIKDTFASVQALIEKPAIPTEGNHSTVDITNLLHVFNAINFSDQMALQYCNPKDLKIDGKVVPLGEIKEYINILIQNTLKSEKITAAPEDPVIRRQFYDEVHNCLRHITYLLMQKEPHKCVGYLLSLAEIGSKCATQYQELPSVLHCILQESEEVFVPCSIPLGFQSPDNLKEHINYLLNLLSPEFSLEILLNNEELNQNIYTKISIAWLLGYLRHFGLKNESLKALIVQEINNNLEDKNSIITQQLKNILSRLHGLAPERINNFLVELISINFDSLESTENHLRKMESRVNQMAGLIQPQGLKDHLLLYLHDERWKFFRTKLGQLPDVIESNVHNYKYIFQNVSKELMIYEGQDSKTKYEDTHVLPQAKEVPFEIKRAFYFNQNILNLLPGVKKFLQSKTAELTDWFKSNAPAGKDPQQFLYEIYDEDFLNIKDEWILYLLEEMKIIGSG